MLINSIHIFLLIIMAALISKGSSTDDEVKEMKKMVALEHAKKIMTTFFNLFLKCVDTKMPLQQFIVDNPAKYLNDPLRTTVGSAPRYTNNRKFFANLITTPQFKEMLARDEEKYRSSKVVKMKFCKKVVLDKKALADLYDRDIHA